MRNFNCMKPTFSLLLALCFSFTLFAQQPADVSLQYQVDLASTKDVSQVRQLLVSGDSDVAKAKVEELGGYYKYSIGNIHSIGIPMDKIADLAVTEGVGRIEYHPQNGQPMLDTALIHNNIDSIHNGLGSLTQAYTGKGVIVGIIDDGIDINHMDFRKPNGDTRIRFIWDQRVTNSPNAPQPFNYGLEWTYQDIDNGICTHLEGGLPGTSHGTNVTGIAAGNGLAVGNFQGVAPDADIISVAIKSGDFLGAVADGVKYIFDKADAFGQPCVINISYGIYSGSHDANDLASQVIEQMVEEKPGRVVVAAAGNAGNIPFHLGYDVTPDSSFTWFRYNSTAGNVYYELWADTADFNDVWFSIGADDAGSYTFRNRSTYFNVPEDFNPSQGGSQIITFDMFDGPTRLGQVNLKAELIEDVYRMEVLIFPHNNTSAYIWRLTTKGEGRFDIWSSSTLTGSANMISSGLPTAAVVPEIGTYKVPDFNKSMVSSFQNSDKVITVANFFNRYRYPKFDSVLIYADSCGTGSPGNCNPCAFVYSTPGELYYTSSWGPTRDERQKPDIAATGSTTITTGNRTVTNATINNACGKFKVGQGGKHIRNGGTSMASPIVAGLAALYLEQKPDATWSEIKQVITTTARTDGFTGSNLPDNKWGYGKVNGFQAMTYPVALGCTDATALNYDPNANIDDGSCILPVEGCTDSTAVNYNPQANVDDGSCMYISTIGGQIYDLPRLFAYPNPTDELVVFEIAQWTGEFENANIIVFDELGQEVKNISIASGTIKTEMDVSELPAGVYFYTFIWDGQETRAEKLFIH